MIEKILSALDAEIYSSDKFIREYDDSQVQKAYNKGMRKCLEIVQEVAKEHGRKLNRCDTCTHYTSEEIVPPICYFCCKGMEDNYKAREEEA